MQRPVRQVRDVPILLQKSKIERPGYEDADDLDHLWSDPVDAWMAHLADYRCPLRRDVRNRSTILVGGGGPPALNAPAGLVDDPSGATSRIKRHMSNLLYPVDMTSFVRREKDPKLREMIVALQKQWGRPLQAV